MLAGALVKSALLARTSSISSQSFGDENGAEVWFSIVECLSAWNGPFIVGFFVAFFAWRFAQRVEQWSSWG